LPGRKLVGAMFYQLDTNECANIEKIIPPKMIDDFPARLVDMINECAPIGLSSLEDVVSTIKKQIESIEREIIFNKESIEDINKIIRKTRDDIDENNKQIERLGDRIDSLVTGLNREVEIRKDLETALESNIAGLISGLKEEANLRKEMEIEFDKKLSNANKEVNDKIKFLKGALWLSTSFVGIVITLFTTWLLGWLKFPQ